MLGTFPPPAAGMLRPANSSSHSQKPRTGAAPTTRRPRTVSLPDDFDVFRIVVLSLGADGIAAIRAEGGARLSGPGHRFFEAEVHRGDGRVLQSLRGAQPSESAADDDHPVSTTHSE